jgi:hypothetical protein
LTVLTEFQSCHLSHSQFSNCAGLDASNNKGWFIMDVEFLQRNSKSVLLMALKNGFKGGVETVTVSESIGCSFNFRSKLALKSRL